MIMARQEGAPWRDGASLRQLSGSALLSWLLFVLSRLISRGGGNAGELI